jgi:LuxR family transcriptional regulator, positive regulator of biofilm formation
MMRCSPPPVSASEAFLSIISKNMLQNELLLSFLKNKTGLKGRCLFNLNANSFNPGNGSKNKEFILIDCGGFEMKDLWTEINSLRGSCPCPLFFALCNVKSEAKIEKVAMDNGIQGVFYDVDPPDVIPKGILAILNGDLWFSRKALTQYLLASKPPSKGPGDDAYKDLLTPREREILALIASGFNSREVSDKLCISAHTVKTHIYNIYSKINVNNRLQATLWAAKYL